MKPAAILGLYAKIPGRPYPCPRPQVTRRNNYYRGAYPGWADSVRVALREACVTRNKGILMTGNVEVTVSFRGAHGSSDIDNLLKGLLDAGTGAVWADDKQVTHVDVWKSRGKPAETEVWIRETPHG